MTLYLINFDQIVTIYVPFLLLGIFILIREISKFCKTRRSFMPVLFCIGVVGWIICESVIFFISSVQANIFIWNMSLIFQSLVFPAQFIFVLESSSHIKIKSVQKALLFVIPLITSIIVLTPLYPLARSVEVISLVPVRYVIPVWNVWFWVHAGYAYLLTFMTVVIILREFVRRPKFYRISYTLMLASIFVAMVVSALHLLRLNPFNLNPTIIMVIIALLFYHLTFTNTDSNLYSRYARGQVFDHFNDLALILGRHDNVVDFNNEARIWFDTLGINLVNATLPSIKSELIEKGAEFKKTLEEMPHPDIHIEVNGFKAVMNISTLDLLDKKQRKHGAIVVIRDVTHNHDLIDKLEKTAKVCSLVGLPNRTAYEGAKKRFDSPEHLPLSVLQVDVNNLKQVNDSLGHKYGDMLLKVTSDILKANCPPGSFVARVGGDEFIFLMPKTEPSEIKAVMKNLKAAAAASKGLPFKILFALGDATKQTEEEDIDDIVELADARMYEDKRKMKGKKI